MSAAILQRLSPYRNTKNVLIYNQSVGDIMTGMLSTHNIYRNEYDKIYNQFAGANTISIARNIYDYLKRHTHYVIEPDGSQTLRSPAAILKMGSNPKIGLDCKSYSLFIGGVLDAFNRSGKKINWCYRFASYRPFDKIPHHVFVVINPGSNKEIWVDPVLSSFNLHKSYFYKIDKPVSMALYSVSGFNDGVGRRSKSEKKEKRKARKEKIKTALKKRGKIFLKFNPASASARNSVLLLIKVNMFQLAMKLHKLSMTGDKLKKFWEKIGGNYNVLLKNIMIGVKHHDKRHKPGTSAAGVGVVPAIAAAIAAATPIILKITQLLKSAGIDSKDLQAAGKKIVSKVLNKKIDEAADQAIDQYDAGGGGDLAHMAAEDGGAMDFAAPEEGGAYGDGGSNEYAMDQGADPDAENDAGEMGSLKRFANKKNIMRNGMRIATGRPIMLNSSRFANKKVSNLW